MPDTFTTDWKKIGQSGPTMDGREIEPQWLLDAAETYDPSTYTAVLWIDHFRFYGNMGKVVELKTEQDGNIVSLFARLQPNEFLLSWNKDKQKLFTSMELTPNFAKSGKCYLSGLGVTDIPASLGTTELHFAHRKQNPDNIILCGVELDDLHGDVSDAEPPTWFSKAMGKLGINLHQQGATPKPEEDTMTRFAAQPPSTEGDGKTVNPAPATEGGQQDFSAVIAEAMKPFGDKLDSIKTEFNAKVDDLTKRFEQANPGTPAPETEQPASGARVL
jgi:hypothetical protein